MDTRARTHAKAYRKFHDMTSHDPLPPNVAWTRRASPYAGEGGVVSKQGLNSNCTGPLVVVWEVTYLGYHQNPGKAVFVLLN